MEQTIKINKEMLATIIKDGNDFPEKDREIIQKLNEENQKLQDKMEDVVRQRDDMSANMLITQ